jgi:hypothetical protein
MIGAIILGVAGVGAISLGIKGFSTEGIPWSNTKKITGSSARAIGTLCLVFGIPVTLLALYLMAITAGR